MSLSLFRATPASGAIDVSVSTGFVWEFFNLRREDYWIVKRLDGVPVISGCMVTIRESGLYDVPGSLSGILGPQSTISSGLLFFPESALMGDATYEVNILGYPSGVYGIPDGQQPVEDDFLGTNYIYEFTTAAAPTPPPPSGTGGAGISQRVFDTAIVKKTTNSRAIGARNSTAANSQYLIQPDGTLKVLVPTSRNEYVIKTSTDNGFTWTDRDNIPDYNWDHDFIWPNHLANHEGAKISLTKIRPFKNDGRALETDPWVIMYGTGTKLYFKGSWDGAWSQTPFDEHTSKFWTGVSSGNLTAKPNGGYYADAGDGEEVFYTAYTIPQGALIMTGYNFSAMPSGITYVLQEWAQHPTELSTASGVIGLKAKEALVHAVTVTNSPADTLRYIPYTKATGSLFSQDDTNDNGSWGIARTITAGNSSKKVTISEPVIDIDGQGNLAVAYTITNAADNVASGFYATSNDDGVTWTNCYNPPPAGYREYLENATTWKTSPSNDILAGHSGFLISTMYMDEDDLSGDLFVKEVPAFDTPEESTVAWRKVNSIDDNVFAGKFFTYTNEVTPNIEQKGAIRMVYQAGTKGNATTGLSSTYSSIYHETLANNAYPAEHTGTSFTKDNIDYYANGYIDDSTQLYMDKIDELGMAYSFTKYEPLETSEINGRGAYGSPTTFEYEACVDPGSYGFPTVARNDSDFTEYIERDTRKIFYKPNTYLDREFVLTKGGILKRTIWLVRIMGNDYEVAQIVPRWLDGSIVYYEANLYVVGPSNDPFSKKILPSET